MEGNIQIDHIHLVLSIPPKYSVSETIGFLKGKSAIKVFDLHHELKRRYWGRHFFYIGILYFRNKKHKTQFLTKIKQFIS